MRKTAILLIAAAIGLAFASPFIAYLGVSVSDSVATDGVFYSWFFAIPLSFDTLVLPESAVAVFGLLIGVYFLQYLVLFTLAWLSLPAARLLNDFVIGPRHRRRGLCALVDRRLSRRNGPTNAASGRRESSLGTLCAA